jgi:hypothetical protein
VKRIGSFTHWQHTLFGKRARATTRSKRAKYDCTRTGSHCHGKISEFAELSGFSGEMPRFRALPNHRCSPIALTEKPVAPARSIVPNTPIVQFSCSSSQICDMYRQKLLQVVDKYLQELCDSCVCLHMPSQLVLESTHTSSSRHSRPHHAPLRAGNFEVPTHPRCMKHVAALPRFCVHISTMTVSVQTVQTIQIPDAPDASRIRVTTT